MLCGPAVIYYNASPSENIIDVLCIILYSFLFLTMYCSHYDESCRHHESGGNFALVTTTGMIKRGSDISKLGQDSVWQATTVKTEMILNTFIHIIILLPFSFILNHLPLWTQVHLLLLLEC